VAGEEGKRDRLSQGGGGGGKVREWSEKRMNKPQLNVVGSKSNKGLLYLLEGESKCKLPKGKGDPKKGRVRATIEENGASD